MGELADGTKLADGTRRVAGGTSGAAVGNVASGRSRWGRRPERRRVPRRSGAGCRDRNGPLGEQPLDCGRRRDRRLRRRGRQHALGGRRRRSRRRALLHGLLPHQRPALRRAAPRLRLQRRPRVRVVLAPHGDHGSASGGHPRGRSPGARLRTRWRTTPTRSSTRPTW